MLRGLGFPPIALTLSRFHLQDNGVQDSRRNEERA